jgi:hypothetical protein
MEYKIIAWAFESLTRRIVRQFAPYQSLHNRLWWEGIYFARIDMKGFDEKFVSEVTR